MLFDRSELTCIACSVGKFDQINGMLIDVHHCRRPSQARNLKPWGHAHGIWSPIGALDSGTSTMTPPRPRGTVAGAATRPQGGEGGHCTSSRHPTWRPSAPHSVLACLQLSDPRSEARHHSTALPVRRIVSPCRPLQLVHRFKGRLLLKRRQRGRLLPQLGV